MSAAREMVYVWVFKGERIILRGSDICYVHLERRKLFVHTPRKTYRISGTLKEAIERLHNLPMVRTHYAYLVNMDYLESISARGAILKDSEQIPVSENFWRQARREVEEYLDRRWIRFQNEVAK